MNNENLTNHAEIIDKLRLALKPFSDLAKEHNVVYIVSAAAREDNHALLLSGGEPENIGVLLKAINDHFNYEAEEEYKSNAEKYVALINSFNTLADYSRKSLLSAFEKLAPDQRAAVIREFRNILHVIDN